MAASKLYDFIIVGQGLAGSLLAYFLMKKGQRVLIFDNKHKGASSKVAAGIINPITGRRFVKSWMFDELSAFNESFYKTIERELGINLYTKRTVLRFLTNIKDINEWHRRSAMEGYKDYMKINADFGALNNKIKHPAGFGEIQQAAQLNMPILIFFLRKLFKKKVNLISEVFDYEKVMINDKSISFNGYETKKIIFCEGHQGQYNPYFKYLPFETSKGEILILRIPALKSEKIIKDKLIIAPLGDDLYWCGSNYEWNTNDESPSEAVRTDFIKKLQKTLELDFEIVDHLAAIRPTVKDRRPFLGLHPKYPQLAIFNGLGTKGASLGPFWAHHFSEFLVEGAKLDQEVDIARFKL